VARESALLDSVGKLIDVRSIIELDPEIYGSRHNLYVLYYTLKVTEFCKLLASICAV